VAFVPGAAAGAAGAGGGGVWASEVAASRRDAQRSVMGRRFMGSPLRDWLGRSRSTSLLGEGEIGQLAGDGTQYEKGDRFSNDCDGQLRAS
jgi:hypothetical protein